MLGEAGDRAADLLFSNFPRGEVVDTVGEALFTDLVEQLQKLLELADLAGRLLSRHVDRHARSDIFSCHF